jgi:hypothetical protein
VSALTLDWQTDGPSQAVIRQGGVLAARLFGLPFLAAGGYLFYQMLSGLLDGGLAWGGWTILPLMGAAFLVPGWILVVARKRVRLDSARREVVEEMDYLVYTYRKMLPVRSESHVMLRYERGSTSSTRGALTTHSRTNYNIHVYVDTAEKLALIALFDGSQKTEALAFAAKAAAFLSIPMKDRMVEGGEVTSGGVVVDKLDPGEADPEEAE